MSFQQSRTAKRRNGTKGAVPRAGAHGSRIWWQQEAGDRTKTETEGTVHMDEKTAALREEILKVTIQVFNDKGLKFTMNDIAERMRISKKTLYKVFDDKEALFLATVDYIFDSIKQSEQRVVEDDALGTVEKVHRILGVLPEGYRDVNLHQLYLLKDKYPRIYKQVELRLETGWETTIELIRQGIDEGCIKPVSIPILKMMLEASLEQFFQRDILIRNGMSYQAALDEVVSILMEGIRVH